MKSTVLVTGGAGYVGAILIPKLLREGHHVKVVDLYAFGDNVLDAVKHHPCLEQIKGDMRDETLLDRSLPVLVIPPGGTAVHVARDREEEVASVARRVKHANPADLIARLRQPFARRHANERGEQVASR